KPLGIMNITAPAMRRLTRAELRLLGTIGLQVGVAIERARLAEESAALARTDERTRLAREIHDTLAQGLVALALQIETALREVGRDPDRVRERLGKALATARANLDEARRSVTDLRRATRGKALGRGLASLARPVSAHSGMRAELETSGACTLDPPVEGELFRIAQQSLDNVRQHARATRVRLALTCTKRKSTLIIEDNGIGFDVRRVSGDRHGIRGMRERAEA